MEGYDNRAWMKHLRRHEDGVFNAFFFDTEDVGEEEAEAVVADVSDFFSLPRPVIVSRCSAAAEVLSGGGDGKSEISYNMDMLRKAGVNNRDAFTLCMVHETAHRIFSGHRFALWPCEMWIQELAADLTAGTYAERHSMATGKYKYALSVQKAALTHPGGAVRREAAEYGRHCLERMAPDGKTLRETVTRAVPAFVYTHYDMLRRDWEKTAEELFSPAEGPEPFGTGRLPDTNLIKQALKKIF